MTKQAELRDLLEQVVNADGPWKANEAFLLALKHFIAETLGASCGQYELLKSALRGDMSAALAFKERMLPGWEWWRSPDIEDRSKSAVSINPPQPYPAHMDYEAVCSSDALALAAAVLKALIKQESE